MTICPVILSPNLYHTKSRIWDVVSDCQHSKRSWPYGRVQDSRALGQGDFLLHLVGQRNRSGEFENVKPRSTT